MLIKTLLHGSPWPDLGPNPGCVPISHLCEEVISLFPVYFSFTSLDTHKLTYFFQQNMLTSPLKQTNSHS